MPVASQYLLTARELTEAIVKATGVHEGKWVLVASFGFAAVNTGPNENEVFPTAMAALQKVGIQLADAGSPSGLVVDAAEVNPAS
jgi:hypothetical protein